MICTSIATQSQLNRWRRSLWPLLPPGPQALVSWWFSSIFVSFFSFSPFPSKSPAFEQVSTTAQVPQRLHPGSSFLPPSIYPSLDECVSEIAFLFQNQRWHDQTMVVCMGVWWGLGRGWRGCDLASINSISLHDVSPAMPVNFQGRACSPLRTPCLALSMELLLWSCRDCGATLCQTLVASSPLSEQPLLCLGLRARLQKLMLTRLFPTVNSKIMKETKVTAWL